ncbi:hypothetical protein [Microbacterium sp. NPDC089695]|uniref:hypothetical protein n=1 Tax=Microbacterium sp. NPDC089695 TaxID=3364198 RepID=UPI0038014513
MKMDRSTKKAARRGVAGAAATLVIASGMLLAVPLSASATELRGPFASRGQCASSAQLDAVNGWSVGTCFQFFGQKEWRYYRD